MTEFAIVGPHADIMYLYRTKKHPDGIWIFCVGPTMEWAVGHANFLTKKTGDVCVIEEVLPDGFIRSCKCPSVPDAICRRTTIIKKSE